MSTFDQVTTSPARVKGQVDRSSTVTLPSLVKVTPAAMTYLKTDQKPQNQATAYQLIPHNKTLRLDGDRRQEEAQSALHTSEWPH